MAGIGLIDQESRDMRTRVVLTVDTEPSVAGALVDPRANRPLLHEPVWGEVDGKSEALGFLIDTLGRHSLRATFFVETAHTTCFPATAMGRYVERLMVGNQDVQLHLHPVWLSFRDGQYDPRERVTDHCSELELPRLVELIEQGSRQIEGWTGRRPTGMRTGNFATAMTVFEAMKEAGLANASNICLASYRPPQQELAVIGGVHLFAGVRELPVTCFSDVGPVGQGKLRPMQVTALSAGELLRLLDQIHSGGGPLAVIITHPFEFLKRSDYRFRNMRPNRLVQHRFEKLCAFLAANPDRFEVVTLDEAASALDVSDVMPPLVGNAVRSTARAMENFVNDRFL